MLAKKNLKQMKLCIMLLIGFAVITFAKPLYAQAATLYWPVPGHTSLSQGYHDGSAIDICDGNIAGADVVAAMGGTVTHIYLCGTQHYNQACSCNGFGTGLVIAGDDGRIYQYAHMQAGSIPTNVYRTAYVSAGQQIGKVGTTGNSTGNHLHFGISVGNYWNKSGINPNNETYYGRDTNNSSDSTSDNGFTSVSVSNITNNDATIKAKIPGKIVKECGYFIGSDPNNLVLGGQDWPNGYVEQIQYDTIATDPTSTYGYLQPGTTYYYYFYYKTQNAYFETQRRTFTTTSSHVDLGDSFNAVILRTDIWRPIRYENDNVVLASKEQWIAQEHWKFIRQSDGTYIIKSLYNGLVLDVYGNGNTDGTNVFVYGQWGTEKPGLNQKWYIYTSGNGYKLVPACAMDKALDVAGGGTSGGTNIQIYTANGTTSQIFSIYKFNEKGMESISMSASSKTLTVGDKYTAKYSFAPANANNKYVTWKSSNPKVATVNDSGVVTAISEGYAAITVTSMYNDQLSSSMGINVTDEVTVSFDANGGSVSTASKKTSSNKISTYPTPTRKNYKFLGWYDENGNKVTTSTIFKNDTTLIAEWKALPVSLEVTKETKYYYVGDELDVDDITIKLIYADGISRYLGYNQDELKNGINMSFPHTQRITYSHEEEGVLLSGYVEIYIVEKPQESTWEDSILDKTEPEPGKDVDDQQTTENPVQQEDKEIDRKTIPTVNKVKSFKATSVKKGLTLTWKKVSGASGYQIQISTKKNFKNTTNYNVKSNKLKLKITKLKQKQNYYVRIRAYKTYTTESGAIGTVYGKYVTISKKTK